MRGRKTKRSKKSQIQQNIVMILCSLGFSGLSTLLIFLQSFDGKAAGREVKYLREIRFAIFHAQHAGRVKA